MQIQQKENGLRESTSFRNDVNTIGPIGENRLKEIFGSKCVYEDISDDKRFRIFDIDFIKYNDGIKDRERVLNAFYEGYSGASVNATTYEVKTDTALFKYRNMVYEELSHGNPGCLARSKADVVFYLAIDNMGRILEEMAIDLHKLRVWKMKHGESLNRLTEGAIGRYKGKISKLDAKNEYQREDLEMCLSDMQAFQNSGKKKLLLEQKYMNRGEDKTLITCIDVDFLIENYGPKSDISDEKRIIKYYKKYE